MTQFLYTLAIIFATVLISVLLLNVKYFIKGEVLKKTCASDSGQGCACTTEGKGKGACENELS